MLRNRFGPWPHALSALLAGALAVIIGTLTSGAWGAGVNKCVNPSGGVTYQQTPCLSSPPIPQNPVDAVDAPKRMPDSEIKIRQGMTGEELIEYLGRPVRVVNHGNEHGGSSVTWYFARPERPEQQIRVNLKSGLVSNWSTSEPPPTAVPH